MRKPFREELRVLRHISAAREDAVVGAALASLEASAVPDVGVEPFADLATWFSGEVAPKVERVALVPDEDAGVLSYLASHLFSGLRFKRQGLVEGEDTLSVLARAEYYLNEKDLDSAARELNQLRGAAKVLLHDWLEAARRRLEVEQALEVGGLVVWDFLGGCLELTQWTSITGRADSGDTSFVACCVATDPASNRVYLINEHTFCE